MCIYSGLWFDIQLFSYFGICDLAVMQYSKTAFKNGSTAFLLHYHCFITGVSLHHHYTITEVSLLVWELKEQASMPVGPSIGAGRSIAEGLHSVLNMMCVNPVCCRSGYLNIEITKVPNELS